MAFYAYKDYTEDQQVLEAMNQVMAGNLGLHWWDAKTEKIKGHAHDPHRGLTYDDLNIGSYGYSDLPEYLRTSQSMVARGSDRSGKLPDMGYVVNRKSDVWSDNVSALYEESKARRWAPATDIPWSALAEKPLSESLEVACAQLYTFLQECELVSLDFPSRWVALINQDFIEQKSFMCAQMLDASRLLEVFRKRALFGGAGLKRASVNAEQGLKEWLWAETYPQASIAINVALSGLLLAIFRHVAAFAPSVTDRAIMRKAMQDHARWTAYGTGALRYHLEHQPGQRVSLHEYLDESEHATLGILGSAELLEPLIIISGGGLEKEQVHAGRLAVSKLIKLIMREYFERLDYASLTGRTERSRLPQVIERVRVD
ncbi:MAG TPA: hypothetical protein VMT64_11900 [Candidatus Binataceae bacterium]|nr:hypothetical protein [Candidatus Binataceae bacterium]